MAYKTRLPWMANRAVAETPAYKLAKIIATAGWQKRVGVVIHPLLMASAQVKAEDMRNRGYYGHTSPIGVTANQVLRATGYPLPSWYPEKGNNIESITKGETEEAALTSWLNSPGHYKHLTGSDKFYAGQSAIGIGHAVVKDGNDFWVFHSAPLVGT